MVTIQCKNQIFTNIQAVLFDKDGTLEDSQSFLRELGIKRARLIDAQIPGIGEPLLMSFGILDNKLDLTGLMAVGTRQENEIAAAAYIAETGRGWFESRAIAHHAFQEADQYLQRNPRTSPIFAGCLDVLKALSQAGLKLGILSADSTANIQRFVEHHQLSDIIQFMSGADQRFKKPDPALFLQACQILNVEPQLTLMVGDAQVDIEMAKQANAAGVIGICWGQSAASILKNADVIISHLDQISILDA
ncbi:HAD family hydrolase [Aphanothece hegewaldii CCALA 016]|uniref:HAD family hydrolase n=1 Tax=Aphanothece hegewaldii CCALA 016 TaxID=2107694 RepID=A0A2T1LWJ7_9CHRO|nr:HAD family hydrolase [Aphanothece hegewaldii]PSF36270.1 HAD family hydrolase [Aphanothece hegewaldii CCALA 016]